MLNIAIDGPSGAGKSTVAKLIAKKLNIIYLDTGAMYRAVAYYMYTKNIDVVKDIDKVIKCLDDISIEISYSQDGTQIVKICGTDVSLEIRQHFVSKMASDVSKIPEVRLKLVALQRDIAKKNDVVLDGRDITSYVLPNSKHKFYLTASAEVRATRRCDELNAKGQNADYDIILKDIIDRDYNDSHRAFAPLVQTSDSVLIDSSYMTIEEVVNKILSYIKG